jgi:hypothetical protein
MCRNGRSRKGWLAVIVCFGASLLAAACDSSNRDTKKTAPADSVSVSENIDKLRALPYLGFTEKPVPREQSGTVFLDTARSHPGYNLYTIPELSTTELVDAEGRRIRSWQGPKGMWSHSMMLPNGELLVVGRISEEERYVMRFDWEGRLLWRKDMPCHHDIGVTPDGRLMVLILEMRRLPEISVYDEVRDDGVAILSQEGEILERRSFYDMMKKRPDIFTFQMVKRSKGSIDLFHANSVRWMAHENLWGTHPIYARGNILISIRHQDTVAVFDWEKGELVWAWGQGEISAPHDAVVLQNGHFLIFDNGLGRLWSRVLELDPVKREVVWEYKAPVPTDFYTAGRGSNQRLPNGNTLITESAEGRAFEVTPGGDMVWEYFNPHVDSENRRAAFARVYRYDKALVENILAGR